MISAPTWVSRQALLLLHEESLVQFGGSRGLRDEGLFDSALSRPQNKFFYDAGTPTLVLAAAYCFGIARNHPFVDGNKRAALLAVILFLRNNGYRVVADSLELEQIVLEIVSGARNELSMAEWLAEHTMPSTI